MIKIQGLKILYAMNYEKEFEVFELTYAEGVDELQIQFEKMVNNHPHCVVKQALVFNEYHPKEESQ